jgi:hypothetical protein
MLAEAHLIPQSTTTSSSSGSSRGGRDAAEAWIDDPTHPCNQYAGHPEMVKGALVAALSPQVSAQQPGCSAGSRPGWVDRTAQELWVHPSSVVHELAVQAYKHPYLVFLEKTKTTRVSGRGEGGRIPQLCDFGGLERVQGRRVRWDVLGVYS